MLPDSLKKACRFRQAVFLTAFVMLAACSGGSPLDSRADVAEQIARVAQFEPVRLRGGAFELFGYRSYRRPATAALTVYVEGDGLAWNAFGTAPSPDPTPRDPVALRLAAVDPAPNRLYLARPCQYLDAAALSRCSDVYWTSDRFAETVIAAYVEIITAQMRSIGVRRVRLVGYSGGGAVAALVAPRLAAASVELATVAAPLDHADWTRTMRISPMTGSLNPADDGARLATIPQTHFVSPGDAVVPESVTLRYLAALGPDTGVARIVRVREVDHWCCWPDVWPRLLGQISTGAQ
jgi:pimeloyl-ACP methyl ester carboxylesterase